SMSNSRLRTKSLRRLRSIMAFSSDFANSVSRASGEGGSKSLHSVAGLATNFTTLRKKLVVSFGSAMSGVLPRAGASVAEHLLFQLPALLGFQRQCSGGACDEATESDRFAGFVTETVVARVDARQRLRNLLEQLSFPVARAQLERMLFLDGGPIG